MSIVVRTPIMLNGYVQWVYSWAVASGEAVHMYGEDFNTPYSPVEFISL